MSTTLSECAAQPSASIQPRLFLTSWPWLYLVSPAATAAPLTPFVEAKTEGVERRNKVGHSHSNDCMSLRNSYSGYRSSETLALFSTLAVMSTLDYLSQPPLSHVFVSI